MTLFLVLLLLTSPSAFGNDTPGRGSALNSPAVTETLPSDSIHSIASTRYAYEWVSDMQAWQNREVSLELSLPTGSVVTSVAQRKRFGQTEVAGSGHYWMDLWGESYGHVYAALAPGALTLAQTRVGGDLYEVVGDWEFSGRYEWRKYEQSDVHVLGPQIGWYVGRWYLRAGTNFIEQNGTWVAMQTAAARLYLGSPDSFVEGRLGYGRNVEVVAAVPQRMLTVVDAYFATVRARHFVTRHIGLSLSGKYSNAAHRRTGLSFGILGRW